MPTSSSCSSWVSNWYLPNSIYSNHITRLQRLGTILLRRIWCLVSSIEYVYQEPTNDLLAFRNSVLSTVDTVYTYTPHLPLTTTYTNERKQNSTRAFSMYAERLRCTWVRDWLRGLRLRKNRIKGKGRMLVMRWEARRRHWWRTLWMLMMSFGRILLVSGGLEIRGMLHRRAVWFLERDVYDARNLVVGNKFNSR